MVRTTSQITPWAVGAMKLAGQQNQAYFKRQANATGVGEKSLEASMRKLKTSGEVNQQVATDKHDTTRSAISGITASNEMRAAAGNMQADFAKTNMELDAMDSPLDTAAKGYAALQLSERVVGRFERFFAPEVDGYGKVTRQMSDSAQSQARNNLATISGENFTGMNAEQIVAKATALLNEAGNNTILKNSAEAFLKVNKDLQPYGSGGDKAQSNFLHQVQSMFSVMRGNFSSPGKSTTQEALGRNMASKAGSLTNMEAMITAFAKNGSHQDSISDIMEGIGRTDVSSKNKDVPAAIAKLLGWGEEISRIYQGLASQ